MNDRIEREQRLASEAAEQQAEITRCRDRLEEITDAVNGYTTENGTSFDQDALLFVTGFKDSDTGWTSRCQTTFYLRRESDGMIEADAPVSVLSAYLDAGQEFVEIPGVGYAKVRKPTPEDMRELRLQEELRSNVMRMLPKWAADAVRREFAARDS